MRLIIITGTPGTGKSTLAKFLALKLGWQRIDLHKYYQQLSSGYNRKKQCYDIDIKKLTTFITEKKKKATKNLIFDSHISHRLPPKLVDWCIVLTYSNLKKLQRRLQERKYSKAKIKENLEVEIFQTCRQEAQEQGHNIMVFDTAKRGVQREVLVKLRKVSKSL